MTRRYEQSQEGRIEELSGKIGGRFKLTSLLQKQMREYVRGGRAFMPSVRNTHELVDYVVRIVTALLVCADALEGIHQKLNICIVKEGFSLC